MAAPKLTAEQKEILLGWLAADYSGGCINEWLKNRGWPTLSDATLSYYRTKWAEEIAAAKDARHSTALNSGLALKEERIRRLQLHADELERYMYRLDDKGRLVNEKAWRETLDDIAKELGQRRQTIDVNIRQEVERLAKEAGLNEGEIMAEVEKILAGQA